MKKTGLLFVIAALVVASAVSGDPLPAATPLSKVLDCMRDNVPPTVRIQEVELTSTDRAGGTRVLKGKLFAIRENGLVRSMLRISAPSDLSGAAYLVRETPADRGDEMYMFLPSVNRVRRISGASAEGALLGTDFSYNDVKQFENAYDGTEPKLEAPDNIQGRPAWVMTTKAKTGEDSRYSTVKTWIDQKTCVALKIDFFEGDKLRKELAAPATGLMQSDKYWYVSEAEMRDLKEGTKTALKVVGVTSGSDLPSRYFDAHSFYLGN